MAYQDYATEIMGCIPKMPFLLAQKAVNRAWREIRESRMWSFLVVEDQIIIPAAISAGSAAVVQFSKTVTLNAAANAAMNGLQNPVVTQRQFRVSNGPVYNIVAYDNVGSTFTLDRLYTEATNAAGSYMVYQCYYDAPVTDFLRWTTVRDPQNGLWLKLRLTMQELNKKDPLRGSFGNPPVYIVPFRRNPVTLMQSFELWPHPTGTGVLQTLYQRRGTDFVAATDTLPAEIPEEVLMTKAKVKAYEWAAANQARFPELKGVNWLSLMSAANSEHGAALNQAKVQDEESFIQNFVIPDDSGAFMSPIDAKYAQSHDVDWLQ